MADYPDVLGRTSFSGADIKAWGYLAGYHPGTVRAVTELEVQTVTLSSYREKVPVRGLGHVNALGHTSGPRTYAGSIIFTVIERHPLHELIKVGFDADVTNDYSFSYDERMRRLTKDRRFTPDALPPFNMILSFANESGSRANVVILGIELVNNGLTMSIEDALTENVYQYVARDAIVLVPVDSEGNMRNIVQGVRQWTIDATADDPTEIINEMDNVQEVQLKNIPEASSSKNPFTQSWSMPS